MYHDGKDIWFIEFVEFIQFTETQKPHEEGLWMQRVSSHRLFSTGSQLVTEPYNPALPPHRLSEAHQKTKASKGLLQRQR